MSIGGKAAPRLALHEVGQHPEGIVMGRREGGAVRTLAAARDGKRLHQPGRRKRPLPSSSTAPLLQLSHVPLQSVRAVQTEQRRDIVSVVRKRRPHEAMFRKTLPVSAPVLGRAGQRQLSALAL